MPENKLKPCPFCGGDAKREIDGRDILTVGCDACRVIFSNHVRFGCKADADWNNRADSKRIAELEAQIESMKCCENCGNAEYDGHDYDCRVDGRCNTGYFTDWKPKGGKCE